MKKGNECLREIPFSDLSVSVLEGLSTTVTDPQNLDFPETDFELMRGRAQEILTGPTVEEKHVWILRMGLSGGRCHSFTEIAKEIGHSPSTARRRFNNAYQKLSHPSPRGYLQNYLSK